MKKPINKRKLKKKIVSVTSIVLVILMLMSVVVPAFMAGV